MGSLGQKLKMRVFLFRVAIKRVYNTEFKGTQFPDTP